MKIKNNTKQPASLLIALGTIALCSSMASAVTISATGWNGDYVFAVGETFGPTIRNGFTYFTEDHTFATTARPGLSTSGAFTLGGIDFQM